MSLGLTLERPLVLFDLEATGPNAMKDRIFQIALKIYGVNGEEESHHTYINPEVPIPRILFFEERGYTDEMIETGCARCGLKEGVHPTETCEKWKRIPRFCEISKPLYAKFKDADFAGYNLKNYDLPLIKEEFSRCDLAFDFSKANILCGLRLWQVLRPRTLGDAVEHWVGRKLENAHSAMADVLGTEAVLRSMLREPNVPQSMEKLGQLLYPADPNQIDSTGKFIFFNKIPCFNFGKNKGQPLASDPGYLSWILKGDFSSEVKTIAREALDGRYPVFREPSKD